MHTDKEDSLSGLEIVRVRPTGLVLLELVQSAKRNQYSVSGCSAAASTFAVKSTSYDVNAWPASTGEPVSVSLSKIAQERQTGTDSGD